MAFKKTHPWDQLAADLRTNETILAKIRAGLEKPVLNNQLDFAQGRNLKLVDLVAPAYGLTRWLGSASQLALHQGDTHGALRDLVIEARLPRLLAEDHLPISELVRIAIGATAKADTWEALQADRWTDEDLAALQRAWESQDFAAAMALASGSVGGTIMATDIGI